jgi:hypothetical protein
MLCDMVARCVSTGRSAAVSFICAPIAALTASIPRREREAEMARFVWL